MCCGQRPRLIRANSGTGFLQTGLSFAPGQENGNTSPVLRPVSVSPRPRPTALSFALGQENGNTPVTGFQVSKKKLRLRLTSPRPWLAHALRDRGYRSEE